MTDVTATRPMTRLRVGRAVSGLAALGFLGTAVLPRLHPA
jgi:hypothetical protein